MMKFTGFISEYGTYGGRLPTVNAKELIIDDTYPDQYKVLAYLNKGIAISASPESIYAIKIIDPMETCIGGNGMYTDGIWIWPSYLSFYVEYFNLRLEEEFYLHMKTNKFEVNDSFNHTAVINHIIATMSGE